MMSYGNIPYEKTTCRNDLDSEALYYAAKAISTVCFTPLTAYLK